MSVSEYVVQFFGSAQKKLCEILSELKTKNEFKFSYNLNVSIEFHRIIKNVIEHYLRLQHLLIFWKLRPQTFFF